VTTAAATPPATLHHHQAFGLQIRSELPLPELLASTAATADIDIRFGNVPAKLPGILKHGVRYQASAEQLLLHVDRVAHYLINRGREILIQRAPDSTDDDLRVFLLGSAIGALLHQRNDLVLHGSAVAWGDACVVFLGHSGVGKSTTASAFRKKGHALLTDDLCVVRPGPDGRMLAYPGFPQTKLWLDSLQQLDLSPGGLRRIRNKLEKRAVPLAAGCDFTTTALPIRKIYLLRPHNKPELKISPAAGPQKFAILKNHTYRLGFLADVESRAGHFQQALKLAQQAPLSVVVRPSDVFQLDELVSAISADLETR
jgi:hypothetical protein